MHMFILQNHFLRMFWGACLLEHLWVLGAHSLGAHLSLRAVRDQAFAGKIDESFLFNTPGYAGFPYAYEIVGDEINVSLRGILYQDNINLISSEGSLSLVNEFGLVYAENVILLDRAPLPWFQFTIESAFGHALRVNIDAIIKEFVYRGTSGNTPDHIGTANFVIDTYGHDVLTNADVIRAMWNGIYFDIHGPNMEGLLDALRNGRGVFEYLFGLGLVPASGLLVNELIILGPEAQDADSADILRLRIDSETDEVISVHQHSVSNDDANGALIVNSFDWGVGDSSIIQSNYSLSR